LRVICCAHSLRFTVYFAFLRGAGAAEAPKNSKFLSEKIAVTPEKFADVARCRTRQYLPSGILINAMEILRLWYVEFFAPLACPRHAIDDLKEARHALR
jgi:hypothetical protein